MSSWNQQKSGVGQAIAPALARAAAQALAGNGPVARMASNGMLARAALAKAQQAPQNDRQRLDFCTGLCSSRNSTDPACVDNCMGRGSLSALKAQQGNRNPGRDECIAQCPPRDIWCQRECSRNHPPGTHNSQKTPCAASGACPVPMGSGAALKNIQPLRAPGQTGCGAAKVAQLRNNLQAPADQGCGSWSNTLSINQPARAPWASAKYTDPGITTEKNYHPSCFSTEFPASQEFQWYPKTFNYAEPASTPSCTGNKTYASAMENQVFNTFQPTSYAALF